jgi:hypothetical protein
MKYSIFAFTQDGTPVEMSHLPESEKHHIEKLFEQMAHRCPECNQEENARLYRPTSMKKYRAGKRH